MEDARGETFFWPKLKTNFIKDFQFKPRNEKLAETAHQIKQFLQPTEKQPSQDHRQIKDCNKIQAESKSQSTHLHLENEHTEGKSFRWKTDHIETTKPIYSILKVETTDKPDLDKMTAADFPATFS